MASPESFVPPEGFLAVSETHRLAIGLKLSRLELHMVRVAALAAGEGPAAYVRKAVRNRLEVDLGADEVGPRWAS